MDRGSLSDRGCLGWEGGNQITGTQPSQQAISERKGQFPNDAGNHNAVCGIWKGEGNGRIESLEDGRLKKIQCLSIHPNSTFLDLTLFFTWRDLTCLTSVDPCSASGPTRSLRGVVP